MSETDALGGALDKPRHIRDDKAAAIAEINDAEIRIDRRERIACDLRVCICHTRKERGLSGIREADERDIGHHFQLKRHIELKRRLARLAVLRRLVRRRREIHISAPAASAAKDRDALRVAREVRDDLSGVLLTHNRTLRDLEDNILAVCAVAAALAALLTVLRAELISVSVIKQRVHGLVDLENHASAAAAVAAVRPAVRHKFLAPERDVAVSALAGANVYSCEISKHKSHLVCTSGQQRILVYTGCPQMKEGPRTLVGFEALAVCVNDNWKIFKRIMHQMVRHIRTDMQCVILPAQPGKSGLFSCFRCCLNKLNRALLAVSAQS